jgi:hypothetical protein
MYIYILVNVNNVQSNNINVKNKTIYKLPHFVK